MLIIKLVVLTILTISLLYCTSPRLHHNVIKTGIRMISLSYSKISLEEIASKLQLDSPEDAEFIVAKV